MLTIYRRHKKVCPHRAEGRKYRRCKCTIWVDGFLGSCEIRKSLRLKNWEKAQGKVRKWEDEGKQTKDPNQDFMCITLEGACEAFEKDVEARELRESTLKKYRVLFKQLQSFAKLQGIVSINQFDLALLRKFRESWSDGGISALKKLERLRAFFRFAHESDWITGNPSKKIRNPKVRNLPTLPYVPDQMIEILAACDRIEANCGKTGRVNAKRVRAFVLFLRYSGMRIGDAAACPKDRIVGNRLFLYTQKTGVPVNVKLPPFVVEALNSVPSISANYFFWSGLGTKETVAGNWRRSLRRVFALAGIKDGHPHRFRDTFAVELLLSGVPLERVSVLLAHSSVKVTEKHYAPWIRSRQEQLEADIERSWARDPIVFRETKGTPEVHAKRKAVN